MKAHGTPLWMPEGSVRSLMALSVVASALYMWVTGQEMTQSQELITTGVVGAYFVVRQLGSGTSPPDGTPPRDLLDVMKQ